MFGKNKQKNDRKMSKKEKLAKKSGIGFSTPVSTKMNVPTDAAVNQRNTEIPKSGSDDFEDSELLFDGDEGELLIDEELNDSDGDVQVYGSSSSGDDFQSCYDKPAQQAQNEIPMEEQPNFDFDREITLGDEPEMPVGHVRKKIVPESTPVDTKAEADMDNNFVFTGSDLSDVMANGNDILAMNGGVDFSQEDSDTLKKMLEEEIAEEDKEKPVRNAGTVMQEMMNSVPQVSLDLEGIDDNTSAMLDRKPEPELVSEPESAPELESTLETELKPALEPEPESTSEPELKPALEPESAIESKWESSSNFRNRFKFRQQVNMGKASVLLPKELPVISTTDSVVLKHQSMNVKNPVQKHGMIEMYNSCIYRDNKTIPWDIRFELQIPEGTEVIVDTGIGIRIPKGYGILLVPVAELEEKFGLKVTSQLNVNPIDAMYSMKFSVKSISPMAYIAKNRALVQVKIFKI